MARLFYAHGWAVYHKEPGMAVRRMPMDGRTDICSSAIAPRQLLLGNRSCVTLLPYILYICVVLLPSIHGHMHCPNTIRPAHMCYPHKSHTANDAISALPPSEVVGRSAYLHHDTLCIIIANSNGNKLVNSHTFKFPIYSTLTDPQCGSHQPTVTIITIK